MSGKGGKGSGQTAAAKRYRPRRALPHAPRARFLPFAALPSCPRAGALGSAVPDSHRTNYMPSSRRTARPTICPCGGGT